MLPLLLLQFIRLIQFHNFHRYFFHEFIPKNSRSTSRPAACPFVFQPTETSILQVCTACPLILNFSLIFLSPQAKHLPPIAAFSQQVRRCSPHHRTYTYRYVRLSINIVSLLFIVYFIIAFKAYCQSFTPYLHYSLFPFTITFKHFQAMDLKYYHIAFDAAKLTCFLF